jgi:cytochrome P450
LVDFDPFSESYFDDPFPIYKQMRDEAPDLYLEEYDCFFLSRFEDIWQAVSDPRFSHRRGTNSQDLLVGKMPQRALSNLVPPEHTALRKSLAPYFTLNAAKKLELEVRDHAQRLLAEQRARGEFDVIADLASRVAARVIFSLIGLPLADADHVIADVAQVFDRVSGTDGPTATALSASERINEYLSSAVRERMAHPGEGDLLAELVRFEWEGRRYEAPELIANLYLFVVGGTETLPKVLSGTLYQLALDPHQRAEVAAEPSLAKHAFWEGLRYEMPTLMLGATAEEDAEVCKGTKVRKGQRVMHLWASANRDEREFPNPDRFDIHRRASRILSFNHGTHRCLGANLAQLEGRVMLEEILALAPEYEVVEEDLVRLRSEFFRGFKVFPIRLGRVRG